MVPVSENGLQSFAKNTYIHWAAGAKGGRRGLQM